MQLETVRLVRQASTKQGTPGRLYATGFTCDTLEPPAPEHRAEHPRIGARTYLCKKIGSPRFPGRYVVMAVPYRSGIVLHPGNYAGDESEGWQSDSDGCIFLGRAAELINANQKRQKAVVLSRSTLAGFESIMGGRDFFLEVIDPTDGQI